MRLMLALLVARTVLAQGAAVVISQVYGGGGNTGAPYRNDYVELFNRTAAPVALDGWSVQYAGATAAAWQVTPLARSIAPWSYYLVQMASGANTAAPPLPAPDATGAVAMSATAAKVALVRSASALAGNAPRDPAIVDLVAYGAADFAEGEPARALSNSTAAIRRGGGCQDTNNNAADFIVGAPAPRSSASPPHDCTAAPPDAIPLAISEIQGPGEESPYVGRRVETTGVVTLRRRNGFYIQTPDASGDGDERTSEGLFVFTSTAPPVGVAPGALVLVEGDVAEYRPASDPGSAPLTELTSPAVTVLATGQPLPAPREITHAEVCPGCPHMALEPFEGMRVRLRALRAVSPTAGRVNETTAAASDTGIFFAVLDGAPRPFREPAPFDENLERLRIDLAAAEGARWQPLAAGARLNSLTGVVDYSSRTWTVVAEPGFVVSGLAQVRPAIPPDRNEFSIASMNLFRLFDGVDDPSTGDPVVAPAALARRIETIAAAIRDQLHSPDVIAVQEAENLAVLRMLAERLGPAWRAWLEEGNDPSGIDCGFLVNTARVVVEAVTQHGARSTYTTPAGQQATLHDRPPLILRGRILDLPFFAVNLHLRSLIDAETPTVQAKRRAQAEAVARLVAGLAADYPAAGVAVLGDFNAFPFDDGLVDVTGIVSRAVQPPLLNLTTTLSREQGYTYIEQGNAQTLDHILINPVLRRRLSRFQVAHLNAHLPVVPVAAEGITLERYSDHDPPLAHFFLDPFAVRIAAAGVTNAATGLAGDATPGQLVTIYGPPSLGPDAGVYFGENAADVFAAAPGQVTAIVPRLGLLKLSVALGGEMSNTVTLRSTEEAALGVFAATATRDEIAVLVTGWSDEPLWLWVDGHPTPTIAAPAPYLLSGPIPKGARRGMPVEVLVVSGAQASQPGVTVVVPEQ